MTSTITRGHSHEFQACLILYSEKKATKSIARGTGSSIGGSSPSISRSSPYLNRGTGSSIGGS